MIIWLNGAFGAGKTATATELLPLVPNTRLFDPETVGYMLRPHLTDHPVSDFQDWPPWRPLVVATGHRAVPLHRPASDRPADYLDAALSHRDRH